MNKNVLALSAAAEAATGLLLLAWPSIVVRLLFGLETSGAGFIMSRIAGISLIGLGVACWPSSDTRRAFYGMLTYSLLAMSYLIVVGLGGQGGILLWPAVVVHSGLAILLIWAHWTERKSHLS